ncbi:MAG: hypothetical protein EOO09_07445 [Chitinophagaceae bacterium]|nr:MAG: hypothetical protein EOO09_07445 [Chitinophagaceae bacterium]
MNYPAIIEAAWNGYDPSRKLSAIEDISASVSTNRVFRIRFTEDEYIIAKISSFGKYEHFKEDHRLIQTVGNNLLYPFENLLAKSLLKNNRVYTYRYKKGRNDAWVVFYNPSRVMNSLPARLDEPAIKALAKQVAKFHKACSRIRNVLPKSKKTLRTDINILLEQLEGNEKKFGGPEQVALLRSHCEKFISNRNKCNVRNFDLIPVFIDWNTGNFSVGNKNELFSRWDYDWFRMSYRVMDLYFFSRVVRDEGDKTVFSYLPDTLMEDRFMLFLREYHKVNPLTADEVRFMKEAYRFFILNYVVKDGNYFFNEQYAKKLRVEAMEIYLPSLDRVFDANRIITLLKLD